MELNGISHFIEHLLFKGTRKRSARQISQDVEGIGGYLNAFTSEENTCFYSRARHDRFDELLKGAPARLVATHTEPQQGRRSYLLVSADPGRVTAALEGITPPAGITATSRTLKASELEVWAIGDPDAPANELIVPPNGQSIAFQYCCKVVCEFATLALIRKKNIIFVSAQTNTL